MFTLRWMWAGRKAIRTPKTSRMIPWRKQSQTIGNVPSSTSNKLYHEVRRGFDRRFDAFRWYPCYYWQLTSTQQRNPREKGNTLEKPAISQKQCFIKWCLLLAAHCIVLVFVIVASRLLSGNLLLVLRTRNWNLFDKRLAFASWQYPCLSWSFWRKNYASWVPSRMRIYWRFEPFIR